MKIVIAGGTGFLGAPLSARLAADGHDVTVLTRGTAVVSPPGGARLVSWTPGGDGGPWLSEIDGAGAIVNLAGEPIAGARWTEAQKQRILDSRVQATRSLVDAIRRAATPPPVFISGSAVGYYGPCGDEEVTEDSAPGSDFLGRVCVRWEAEANRAAGARTRVTIIRTGIVLEKGGGALPPMLPPFKFGVGGPVGSGRQVLAVDSPHGLDRSRVLDAPDVVSDRRRQRDGPDAGHQCRLRPRARPRPPSSIVHAGARVHAQAAARRDGRRAPVVGAARRPREGPAARIRVSVREARRRAGGHLRTARLRVRRGTVVRVVSWLPQAVESDGQ